MGVGGNWKNEVRAVLRPGGEIKSKSRWVGARPWIPGRENGLARGIYTRLVAGDRFSWKQILTGGQSRLALLIQVAGIRAAYWLLGPIRRIFFGWGHKDGDLLFS